MWLVYLQELYGRYYCVCVQTGWSEGEVSGDVGGVWKCSQEGQESQAGLWENPQGALWPLHALFWPCGQPHWWYLQGIFFIKFFSFHFCGQIFPCVFFLGFLLLLLLFCSPLPLCVCMFSFFFRERRGWGSVPLYLSICMYLIPNPSFQTRKCVNGFFKVAIHVGEASWQTIGWICCLSLSHCVCSMSCLPVITPCSVSCLPVITHCSVSCLPVISHCSMSCLPVITHCSVSCLPVITHCSMSCLPVITPCSVSCLPVITHCSVSCLPVITHCSVMFTCHISLFCHVYLS